jgi:hypothetical protein
MPFTLFHQDSKRIFFGKRGLTGSYSHRFGGPANYSGLAAYKGQPPVHLLFRLDTADARIGVALPGVKWLPLFCAIRYGACELAYRVTSDDAIQILFQRKAKAWKGFPRKDYPAALPSEPVDFHEGSYHPANPKDAYCYAGAFGFDALTPAQFAAVERFVVAEGFFDAETSDYGSLEDYLDNGAGLPFCQGPPRHRCPDPACTNHTIDGTMRPFALFQEEDSRVRDLWGPNCGSLQIIWLICPACSAILTTNQAD